MPRLVERWWGGLCWHGCHQLSPHACLEQGQPVREAGRLATGHEGVRGALLHGLRVRGGQGPHGEAAQGGAAGPAPGWLRVHHRLEPGASARVSPAWRRGRGLPRGRGGAGRAEPKAVEAGGCAGLGGRAFPMDREAWHLPPTSAASYLSPGCVPFLPEVVCPRGRRPRRTWGAWLVMSCSVLRLTREPVAESPKKKRWEAPNSLHPPRGAGPTTRGGGAQSQRGTPGAGGAGRARGSSFAKFGNRNVFMKDHSSSSSTDSRSRSSSRSPTRHFRRRCAGFVWGWAGGGPQGPHRPASPHSDSHSDSDSSYSGNECQPVGRRNPPPKGRGGRGAHMDRGRGRAQRGKR